MNAGRCSPFIALGLAALLGGCGGASRESTTAEREVRAPHIVDSATGETLSIERLAEQLDGARAIYIGERHDSAADHEVQRALIAALLERDPSLAIGMEMFQRPYQAHLDAWVAGTIDEAELLRATEWDERWSIDFGLYRPILELARVTNTRVIALNARRELTRAISREGIDALSPELRAEMPELVTDDAEHRAMIEEALGGHGAMDPQRLERFYLAQLTWDEAMGTRVAEVMSAEDAPHRIVVLAGRMHVQSGLGIPRRAARRGVEPFRVVLPIEEEELAEARDLGDYVIVP